MSDAEMVHAARAGDGDAFALLARRHTPALRAVAIAVLGYVPEVDDVVQDTLITALRKLPDLRDPSAAGPWLRTIVRSRCRMLLRARRDVPVADPGPLLPPDPGPEEMLDRAVTRDRVQRAVAELPAAVREATLLRYFSAFSSYRDIAAVCGVTEDTVRSRLRAGRSALWRVLRDTTGPAWPETGAAAAARQEAEAAIAAGLSGHYHRMVEDRFLPSAPFFVEGRFSGDRTTVADAMDDTLEAGVRLRLHDAAISGDVMLWETEFLNPAADPEHCPPAMAWLYTLAQGRVGRLRIAYRRAPLN